MRQTRRQRRRIMDADVLVVCLGHMSLHAFTLSALSAITAAGAFCLYCLLRIKRERDSFRQFSRRLLAAQEMERKRIASALHDGLNQDLLIIKNRAELALASGNDRMAVEDQLREISKACGPLIDGTRRIAHDLGPYLLDQLGLTEVLDAMIDRVQGSNSFRVERKLESIDDLLSRDATISFYRIVQEMLNNVMRHANASLVSVHLTRDLREIRLVVQDDGLGFDMATGDGSQLNGNFGLVEMAERARILGGTLTIESRPEQGTRVEVDVPIEEGCRL